MRLIPASELDSDPRVLRAASAERLDRAGHWYERTWPAGHWQLRVPTLYEYGIFEADDNAFIYRLEPQASDYIQTLVMLGDAEARDAFDSLGDEALLDQIKSFWRVVLSDRPGGSSGGVGITSSFSLPHWIKLLASEFGWGRLEILNTPAPVAFQLAGVCIAHARERPVFDPYIMDARQQVLKEVHNNG